jgi:ribosomal protein S18 acetylase RimI-like enzyme
MIRAATQADGDALWQILEPVIRAGETLAMPRDLTRDQALAQWLAPDREACLLEEDGQVLGTFYIKANQAGGGDHVANAGYVTAMAAHGRGIARRMCAASLDMARSHGFRAMQFNLVISSNSRAIALWQGMGFEIVGRLPAAFAHPSLGYVDALVMYRTLLD